MLNTFEMQRYIAATARRADLQVEWQDDAAPMTDGKRMVLPKIKANITLPEYKRLRHFVTHEVDHINYSDFAASEGTGLGADTSLLGAIWNVVEDHRIEFLGTSEYEGDRLCSNDVHGEMMVKVAKAASGSPDKQKVETFMPLLEWVNEMYGDFYPTAHVVAEQLSKATPEKGKETLAKLKAGNYADELRRIRTIVDKEEGTAATLKLAERIFKEVYDQDPEAEKKRCAEQAKKDGKGKGKGKGEGEGEGKGEGEGEGNSDGEGEAKAGKGEEDGKGKGKKTVIKPKNYSDLMADNHDSKGKHGHGLTIDYSHYSPDDNYTPPTAEQFKYVDWAKRPTGFDSSEIASAVRSTSASFAHQVRAILQIRARDTYQYGTKTGKLHNSQLHRLLVKNAPKGYSERVFKKKQVHDVLNAAVSLLVDQSGSMSGRKYHHAAAAATMMSETLGNTLHVPCEVATFNDQGGCVPVVHLIRNFNEKLVPKDKMIGRFSSAMRSGMSGNGDGDHILAAFDRLIARPEKRKLLIVFSDGQPAGWSGYGDGGWYTGHVIKQIENESPVEIVGIGIQDESVVHYYKNHRVIRNADGLETALLSVIEEHLK